MYIHDPYQDVRNKILIKSRVLLGYPIYDNDKYKVFDSLTWCLTYSVLRCFNDRLGKRSQKGKNFRVRIKE